MAASSDSVDPSAGHYTLLPSSVSMEHAMCSWKYGVTKVITWWSSLC